MMTIKLRNLFRKIRTAASHVTSELVWPVLSVVANIFSALYIVILISITVRLTIKLIVEQSLLKRILQLLQTKLRR